MDLGLRDKKAFVAASSRGLGYATALGLAREGCKVAINGRDEEKTKAAAEQIRAETGAEVLALAGDVTDPQAPASMIADTQAEFGGLDILVTNAGGPPAGSFEAIDEAGWKKGLDLSFMSHVRFIQAALPLLRKSSAGAVLAIVTYVVKQPMPNLVLSNSIRAATVGLVKSLALDLGKEGIRFNSVLPGWTMTERVQDLMTFRAKNNGTTVEEEIRKQEVDIPLGRMGQPEEFANAAVFLVSPAASFIQGVALPVDGGLIKMPF
jgi:3-oxoacyl-[acyl-carrier protein] reductase